MVGSRAARSGSERAQSPAARGITVIEMQQVGRLQSPALPGHYARAESAGRGAVARFPTKQGLRSRHPALRSRAITAPPGINSSRARVELSPPSLLSGDLKPRTRVSQNPQRPPAVLGRNASSARVTDSQDSPSSRWRARPQAHAERHGATAGAEDKPAEYPTSPRIWFDRP